MRVLVVEDRGDTQDTLETYLRLHGCWTDHAGNGHGALARLAVSVPDAIVTDHIMPGMTGLEFVTCMRQDEDLCNVPVALISGVASTDVPDLVESLKRLGPIEFFHKPFEPEALLNWLRDVTGKHPRDRKDVVCDE